MTDLSELIERVRAATGADREIDALIHAMADGRTVRENMHPQFGRQLLARNSRPPHDEYWLDHPANVNPPVTGSTDAALALAEKVLPDANCYGVEREPQGWTAYMSRNNVKTGHWMKEAQAPTAPLAIILATLLALQSQEPK